MVKPDYSTDRIAPDEQRAALVIAHPGHELCLYGWLKRARPLVFILTDGSSHSGIPRIERTTGILKGLGAAIGSVYGRFTDIAIYDALLNHRFDLFINLAHELAAQINREGISCVVGDALEGYNPTHDVCRLVIDSAVEIAGRAEERKISNLEFLVIDRPGSELPTSHTGPIRINLDEAAFKQKLMAARNYLELKDEIEAFIKERSEESFRSEYLYPVNNHNGDAFHDRANTYYEEYGERRVKQGYYKKVIRHREHVLPLAERLKQAARG